MKTDQKSAMMEIMNELDGVTLREKRGGRFRFRMHLTPAMSDSAIEALDLGVRSYHSLKRAGYNSIGEVAEAVASGKELKSIKNCGSKSVREIMEHMFLFQYYSLKPEKRGAYLREVVELNIKPGEENTEP